MDGMIYRDKELFKSSNEYCFILGDINSLYDYSGECLILDIDEAIDLQKEEGGDIIVFKRRYLRDYMSAEKLFDLIFDSVEIVSYADESNYIQDYMNRNKDKFLKALENVANCFDDEFTSGKVLGVFKE